MKKFLLSVFLITGLMLPVKKSHADLFGGDVAVLAQILVNALQQLAQLKELYDNAKEGVEYVQEINQGINDSLKLIKKINPSFDPGVFRSWDDINLAINELQRIYGKVVESPVAEIQKTMDKGIAEAVTLNNDVFKHAKRLDKLSERIKNYSHNVSPGGAQKLTAQSMGVMLQAMNESLRVQATGLKLQAQAAAISNKRDKDETKLALESSKQLKVAMKKEDLEFSLPKFN